MAGRPARRLVTASALFILLSPTLNARQGPATGTAVSRPQAPGAPSPGTPPRDPSTGPRDTPPPAEGTARISGRVVGGPAGQPLRRAIVRLNGEALEEALMTATDEDGRYAFEKLPAGRFFVTAGKGGYVMVQHGQRRPGEGGRPIELGAGQRLDNVDFNLPRGGVITGRITDEAGEPAPEVPIRVMRYTFMQGRRQLVPAGGWNAETDDLGRFRIWGLPPGEYFVQAAGENRSFGMAARSDVRTGYAPTYFPGTPSLGEAQPIRLGTAEEIGSVSFALVPARTSRVTGTVLNSTGEPVEGGFIMVQEGTQGPGMFSMRGGGMIKRDGTFVVPDLAPGEYVLHANQRREGTLEEWASVRVAVTSEDITGLTIVTSPGSALAGQAFFETAPAADVKPSDFHFFVTAVAPISPMRGGLVTLRDDWTLEGRMHESPGLIRAAKMPDGWALKAVMHGGVDVTDTGIEFRPGERIDGVQLVFTNRISSVSGIVRDERGRAARDYTVVVFADDPARWTAQSRHIGVARPAQDGRFEIRKLPAGHYLAAAVDYLEEGRQSDPEYLAELRTVATPLQLSDGEQRALTLELVTNR